MKIEFSESGLKILKPDQKLLLPWYHCKGFRISNALILDMELIFSKEEGKYLQLAFLFPPLFSKEKKLAESFVMAACLNERVASDAVFWWNGKLLKNLNSGVSSEFQSQPQKYSPEFPPTHVVRAYVKASNFGYIFSSGESAV